MGITYRAIEFDEDHLPGQKLIEAYNRTSDYTNIVYVDEHGNAHKCLSGSDPMIDALVKLLHNKDCREVSQEEMELAYQTVYRK